MDAFMRLPSFQRRSGGLLVATFSSEGVNKKNYLQRQETAISGAKVMYDPHKLSFYDCGNVSHLQ